MPTKTIHGNNLYYEVHGNPDAEKTIAFLNGISSSAASWAGIWPVFEDLGYKIIVHDFKGQMLSDKPEGPYTMDEIVDDAHELFHQLGVNKIHLAGLSFGGRAAMKYALKYPEDVETLMLMDTLSETDAKFDSYGPLFDLLCKTGQAGNLLAGMLHDIYGNDYLEKHKDELAERARILAGNPAGYLDGQLILNHTFGSDPACTSELKKIEAPVMIIVGEEDFLAPRKFSDIMARELPDAEYVVLPGSGHCSTLEKPETIKTLLSGFTEKHSRKKS